MNRLEAPVFYTPDELRVQHIDGFEVISFPKRQLTTPLIFAHRDQYWINQVRNYLDDKPIYVEDSAKFYSLHPEFADNNQFRLNRMTSSIGAMQLVAKNYIREGRVAFGETLKGISKETIDHIAGVDTQKPYQAMTDPVEKLDVVHYVEDQVVRFLTILENR